MKTGKKEKSALGTAVGADNHGPWSDEAKNRAYSQCLPTLLCFWKLDPMMVRVVGP